MIAKRAPQKKPKPKHASKPKPKPKAKTPKRARRPAGATERAVEVLARLSRAMPVPRCELDHADAWQLLVATILSAQSTDKMINKVTPVLFAAYPTPAALGAASQEDVERIVKPTGFFRNKAKAIREASRLVAERHAGVVPRTVEELTGLPGVARKTANVVLGTAYRVPSGVTIDTHAGRVSRRLGLTREDDPVKVELDLMELFPKDAWIDLGHRFVLHGRYVCDARKPRCGECPLAEICPSVDGTPTGNWQERADRESRVVESRGAEGRGAPLSASA